MKPVSIDFSPPRMGSGPLAAVFFTLALLLCLGAVREYVHALEENSLIAGRLAAAREARSGALAAAVPIRLSRQQIDAANEAIEALNLPWMDFFSAFEGKLPDGVSLLALEPNARERVFRIQAEARTPEDMVSFAQQMDSTGRFKEIVLTKHEVAEDEPGHPVRFMLQARWGDEK